MKILLQASEIIARRPQWTDNSLRRFVEPEQKRHSVFSRAGKDCFVYDMQKVIEAEKRPEFIAYQAKRKEKESA